MLKKACCVADRKKFLYYENIFSYIHIAKNGDGADTIFEISGTNGQVLMVANNKPKNIGIGFDGFEKYFVISREAAAKCIMFYNSFKRNEREDLFFCLKKNRVFFRIGKSMICLARKKVKYPDYKRVVRQTLLANRKTNSFVVEREALLAAIKKASTVDSSHTRLTIHKNEINVLAINKPEKMEIAIPVSAKTDKIIFAYFMIENLNTALKAINSEKIRMKMKIPVCIMRGEDSSNEIVLIRCSDT